MDPENPDEDIIAWLKAEMKKMLDEEFAKLPWWCLLCGEGGNYEGQRPDQYWFPPEDHVCNFKPQKLIGFPEIIRDE